MSIKIRKSELKDIDSLLEIYRSAVRYMRKNNNNSQWNGDYPGRPHLIEDINNGNGYLGINEEGLIVMTFAFILGDDPTYRIIRAGEWLNNKPYGTIHRLASNGTERGVLKTVCDYCFQLTENIRIDTHKDNYPMQKALQESGFVKCGEITCRDGSPRIAYQKIRD